MGRIVLAVTLLLLLGAVPAWAQCTVYKTWSTGEIPTAADVNASFQRMVDANIPTCVGDYSASAAQMRTATDPYPSSTESLATTLAGELERMRYQLNAAVGKTYWYQPFDNSLAKDVPKHWGATYTKFKEIADPSSPPANELALYGKDDGAGVTVLAYKDSAGTVNTLTGASTSYGNSVTTNLKIARNSGTPTTKLDVTADRISVAGRIKTTLSVTINAATTGANALDTGSLANATLYYVWVIFNPSTGTFAGLASTSETAPTMPSGYTLKRVVGAFRTNGSAQFIDGIQLDNVFHYAAGQSVAAAITDVTATALDLATYIPNLSARAVLMAADVGDTRVFFHWQSFTPGAAGAVAGAGYEVSGTHLVEVGPSYVGPIRVPTYNSPRSTIYYALGAAQATTLYVVGWEIQWRE